MPNNELEAPNIALILAAYAKVANRVAEAVMSGDEYPNPIDLSALASLSSAVQAIGSEYRRHVLTLDVAQGQQKVQLS